MVQPVNGKAWFYNFCNSLFRYKKSDKRLIIYINNQIIWDLKYCWSLQLYILLEENLNIINFGPENRKNLKFSGNLDI